MSKGAWIAAAVVIVALVLLALSGPDWHFD